MEKKYKAVEGKMSKQYDKRYVIVDTETGEVLDDCQGWGYKTIQKAYAGYGYRKKSTSGKRDYAKKKIDLAEKIAAWEKEHHFMNLFDGVAFDIAKGSYGPDDKMDTKMAAELLSGTDCPFKPSDILWYWKEGGIKAIRKKFKK